MEDHRVGIGKNSRIEIDQQLEPAMPRLTGEEIRKLEARATSQILRGHIPGDEIDLKTPSYDELLELMECLKDMQHRAIVDGR